MTRAAIPGTQEALAVLGDFMLSQFGLVREFHLRYDNEANPPCDTVDLVMEREERGPRAQLVLRFTGVIDLSVCDFYGRGNRISGFTINNINDWQWENASWKVDNFENSSTRITFCSKTAEIVSARLLE